MGFTMTMIPLVYCNSEECKRVTVYNCIDAKVCCSSSSSPSNIRTTSYALYGVHCSSRSSLPLRASSGLSSTLGLPRGIWVNEELKKVLVCIGVHSVTGLYCCTWALPSLYPPSPLVHTRSQNQTNLLRHILNQEPYTKFLIKLMDVWV